MHEPSISPFAINLYKQQTAAACDAQQIKLHFHFSKEFHCCTVIFDSPLIPLTSSYKSLKGELISAGNRADAKEMHSVNSCLYKSPL